MAEATEADDAHANTGAGAGISNSYLLVVDRLRNRRCQERAIPAPDNVVVFLVACR